MYPLSSIESSDDMPVIQLSLRFDIIGKDKSKANQAAEGWERWHCNAVELAQHVASGGAIAVGLYYDGHRAQENAEACYVLGLDFEHRGVTAEQVAADELL